MNEGEAGERCEAASDQARRRVLEAAGALGQAVRSRSPSKARRGRRPYERTGGLPHELILANSEGRLRAVDEHRRLLDQAGLRLSRTMACGPLVSLIEAEPASKIRG